MVKRAVVLAALPAVASAGIFGPPQFVKDACKKWCDAADENSDAADACKACKDGPQQNPECAGADCDYCKREITFKRHYPKLWREEKSFHSDKIEGHTRCWCETGCPVYKVKSFIWCHEECAAICAKDQGAVTELGITV
eukprot:TRINITY_DN114676_c0_g1_i1.p2 TRINITY_DN114676_c0_g1~~TRINITY_DN114676_c0_g1_i1.p2  ORF type:complete len:162 (+),score=31.95 TRINITY_DN114676_c0_g1_i1:70-486(+)